MTFRHSPLLGTVGHILPKHRCEKKKETRGGGQSTRMILIRHKNRILRKSLFFLSCLWKLQHWLLQLTDTHKNTQQKSPLEKAPAFSSSKWCYTIFHWKQWFYHRLGSSFCLKHNFVPSYQSKALKHNWLWQCTRRPWCDGGCPCTRGPEGGSALCVCPGRDRMRWFTQDDKTHFPN